MSNNRFFSGEPYWAECNSCNSGCLHEYAGYWNCEGVIENFHLGTCTNCRTSTKINLETKTE